MTQNRVKRMDPLIRIAEKSAQEALAYMGQIQQKIREEEGRSSTLLEYQAEYQTAFAQKGQAGVNGLAIEQHESFMKQIQQAMDQQRQNIHRLEEQLEKAKDVHQALNQKLKTYQKLQDRFASQALAIENKQMQKWLDEIALQMSVRKQSVNKADNT